MRLGRLVRNDSGGLLDSGATHPLRPRGDDEDESRLRSVEVVLADGAKKQLHMTSGGTMLSHHQEVEPLVPMGLLTTVLDCNVTCGKDKTCKWSIRWGGDWRYPTVNRKLALELIEEIEKKRGGWLKEINFNGEETCLRFPARSHPVPEHKYKTKVGWHGGSLEWLAGEQTSKEEIWEKGADGSLLRWPWRRNDVEEGYARTRRADWKIARVGHTSRKHSWCSFGKDLWWVFESMFWSLRHFPIEGQTNFLRPVRSWEDGQECGLKDLTEDERSKVHDDEIMMWRMITLFMVASYVRRALSISKQVGFSMEQPASSKLRVPCRMQSVFPFGISLIGRRVRKSLIFYNNSQQLGDSIGSTMEESFNQIYPRCLRKNIWTTITYLFRRIV